MKTKRPHHSYTTEELEFIKRHIKNRSYADLTSLFNESFNLSLTVDQIKAVLARYKLCNGRDRRFLPGHVPHNKGKKGIHLSPATEFKPGNRPVNYMPVGTERINTDGYAEIKIKDPNKWKPKHRIIWEEANGPIPPGHVIIFADGDKSNIDLDNLLMVSRRELAIMNHEKLIHNDRRLTKAGQMITALKMRIFDRQGRPWKKAALS